MDLTRAFLMATGWAYLGAFMFTLVGKPGMAEIDEKIQAVFYLLAGFLFLYLSGNVIPSVWYYVLAGVYAFATVSSFIGYPQVWMAYWTDDPSGGSAAQQVMMSAWDLMIAVCLFTLG